MSDLSLIAPRKTGPKPKPFSSVLDRLTEDANGCWLWTGAMAGPGYRTGDGYGIVGYGGRLHRVHRLVYQMLVGPIPEGLEIDHLCRVRTCANPAHLEAVTHLTNMQRAVFPSRRGPRPITHCPRGHAYTDENTYWQEGRRSCRACRNSYRRRRKEGSHV